jgi:hypothetical protein
MDELLALSRAELENAKRFSKLRLFAHGGTLTVSVAALFISGTASYLLAVLAVLTELTAWACRSYGEDLHAHADRGLRRGLLVKSLGAPARDLDAAAIEVEFSKWAHAHADAWRDADYWATTQEQGPAYLRTNVQESAFWSGALYREAARTTGFRFAVFSVTVAAVLVGLLVVDSHGTGVTLARVITVAMGVLVCTDELSTWRSFHEAAEVCERTCERLQHADMAQLAEALALFADYATATTAAAPIPTGIYSRKHNEIERAWRRTLVQE